MQSASHLDTNFYLPADAFFRQMGAHALTYDDVSLATAYSEVLPKETHLEVQLSEHLRLPVPIISSDMDTVTEAPMAIAMALAGGMGLIHYNLSPEEQVRQVARVKHFVHGLIQDPVVLRPDLTIGEVQSLVETKGYPFSTFPVVDAENRLVGLLPGHAVRPRYASKPVSEVMVLRAAVPTILIEDLGKDSIQAAQAYFERHWEASKLAVVDKNDRLRGLFTRKDIEAILEEAHAQLKPCRDSDFRLVCGAALSVPRKAEGALDTETLGRHVQALVDAGLNTAALSSAHAFTKGMGEALRFLKQKFPHLTLIAGNVTSGAGVEFLADAGADAIKIGQGPGSICTTRIVAGVGIPQLTALYVAQQAAVKKNVKIIADGGISKSGDMVKALTLADAVICGGLLASCPEAPGQIFEIDGKRYKQYRGMGSLEAMKAGSAARYGHDASDRFKKSAAEGIEALKEVSEPVSAVLGRLIGGVQAGMGYLGAHHLQELKAKARYVRVSPAGLKESNPHDVIEMKMTPNRG
jgi:IMP dehydrogenase